MGPIGPIGLLCIRKTIQHGFSVGLSIGLGATLADILYGSMIIMGINQFCEYMVVKKDFLYILSGIFLLLLGVYELIIGNASKSEKFYPSVRAYFAVQSFLFGLTNPSVMIPFCGIFAVLDIHCQTIRDFFAILSGLFMGSISWWLFLTFFSKKIHQVLSEKILWTLNFCFAVFLIMLGLYCLQTYILSLCPYLLA